ncbi:MAG: hypothetical protein QGI60_00305 [archaeon]|jgi:hypothetical protein|nr:hypothetical protein [archaeon]
MPKNKNSMTWRQRAARALKKMKLKSGLRRVRAEIHNQGISCALHRKDERRERAVLGRMVKIGNPREAEVSRPILEEIRGNIQKTKGLLSSLKEDEKNLQAQATQLN